MNLLETRGPHRFGPWTVTQLVEWEGEAFPHNALFPELPASAIREASPSGLNSRLTESGMIVMSTQLFVLRQKDLVILIELGTGNGKTRPAETYWDHQNLPYLETLATLNVQPEDVVYVFLSHLHVDHVGLATTRKDDRWLPTFPKAKYMVNRTEWEYWSNVPSDGPRWHRRGARPGQRAEHSSPGGRAHTAATIGASTFSSRETRRLRPILAQRFQRRLIGCSGREDPRSPRAAHDATAALARPPPRPDGAA